MKTSSFACVFAALAVSFVAAADDSLPTDHVFAPTSFWYTPILANAPLHTNSANFVKEFVRQKKTHYGTVGVNTTAYASPVYVVGADVPTVRVTYWNCQNIAYVDKTLEEEWAAVPMPKYAEPADGTDAEMTIWQPSTDRMWDFWRARTTNGAWQACWGGRMEHVSKSDGIWPHNHGTTATSLPFIGGQITADELRRGEIKHALGICLVELETWQIRSWPATRSDGWNPKHEPNRIPEGLRFRLDPKVDVDALNLCRAGKTIAKAAQKYGFVVWDMGGAITLRAENPRSFTMRGLPDPYPELFEKKPGYAILEGIPWERLKFLPMDYGKP